MNTMQAPPQRTVAISMGHRLLPWLALYALLIVYSSTVIGPSGLNFVPIDLGSALQEFEVRAFTWIDFGSDQRADWMGNLSMFVPLGFLLAGTLWPDQGGDTPVLAKMITAVIAFAFAVVFLLLVKFAQLYFPPRTVTLNYVIAQSLGALIGIVGFGLLQDRLNDMVHRDRVSTTGLDHFRMFLRVYCVALFIFILMPLDFALSREDLLIRLHSLESMVTAMPGADRPIIVQVVLLAFGAMALVPFGMLLVLKSPGRNRSVAAATAAGFGWMVVLLLLTALLVSGAPALVSLLTRTVGILVGAWFMRWLAAQHDARLLETLRALAAWLVIPYLLVVLAVNGLLSTHWHSMAQAKAAFSPLGLLPFYDYYIVGKAAAAKNAVSHVVMYAPIGLVVWLRGGRAGQALGVALVLACAVEAGRYLRPGLQGDINAVVVGGLSAFVTVRLMPVIWSMLGGIQRADNGRVRTTA